MKFILNGGWNKRDKISVKNDILFQYGDILSEQLENNKKVLIITNAKPTGYYQDRIQHFVGAGAVVIGRDILDKVNWKEADCILTLGGNAQILYSELVRLGFDVSTLKSSLLYIGESAGVMVMSSFFYDYDQENNNISFHKGILPGNKEIYLVHANNPIYTDSNLKASVQKFAEENGLTVVPIKENEVIEREF